MYPHFSSRLLGALTVVVGATLMAAPAAHAAAVAGQGTWETTLQGRNLDGNAANGFEAYYDTDLNITWLADANYAKTSGFDTDGMMTWSGATAWAAGLNVHGITGWRLPTMVDTGTPGCAQLANSGTDCGYNVTPSSAEMAHMFYVTLGNKGNISPSGTAQAGAGLVNSGPFLNAQNGPYWLGTSYVNANSGNAWFFGTAKGIQNVAAVGYNYFGWAVRSGDIAVSAGAVAAVPEAETMALALVGIGITLLVRRRKK